MLVNLPVFRMMREHKAGELRAASIEARAAKRQHEIARRVQVLEWMSPPHDSHQTPAKGTSHGG